MNAHFLIYTHYNSIWHCKPLKSLPVETSFQITPTGFSFEIMQFIFRSEEATRKQSRVLHYGLLLGATDSMMVIASRDHINKNLSTLLFHLSCINHQYEWKYTLYHTSMIFIYYLFTKYIYSNIYLIFTFMIYSYILL